MDLTGLAFVNPWWSDKSAINKDEKVTLVERAPLKYTPNLNINPDKVYVLRGPRQVGKTTFLKLKIKELIERGTEPKSILYYSCDQFKKPEQLNNLLKIYLEWCADLDISPTAIFLDEVTTTTEWASVIKHVKNTRAAGNAAIVLTGSNSVDLKHGAERLPGRGIEGNEYFYYPICFRSFCELMGKKMPPSTKIDEILLKVKNKGFIAEISALAVDSTINKLFNLYLQTGGFMLSINNYKQNMPTTFETYARWIEGDLSYFKKDSRFAKQVLCAISAKNASQSSVYSITKATEISSPVTVKEYLSLFEDMQMLLVLNKYDAAKKQWDYKKEKKYHFIDPLLYKLVPKWTETKETSRDAVIEATVASHVHRWVQAHGGQTGFYNNGKFEVDVVVKSGNGLIPIEVKCNEKINSQDWKGLYKMGKGILLNKSEFGFVKERYLKIPIAVFLALLDIPALIPIKYVLYKSDKSSLNFC